MYLGVDLDVTAQDHATQVSHGELDGISGSKVNSGWICSTPHRPTSFAPILSQLSSPSENCFKVSTTYCQV